MGGPGVDREIGVRIAPVECVVDTLEVSLYPVYMLTFSAYFYYANRTTSVEADG